MTRGKDLKVRARRCDRNMPDDKIECIDCGKEYRRSELSTRHLCVGCSTWRVISCCRQLQEKKGAYYERYLTGVELSKINMKGGSYGKEG